MERTAQAAARRRCFILSRWAKPYPDEIDRAAVSRSPDAHIRYSRFPFSIVTVCTFSTLIPRISARRSAMR